MKGKTAALFPALLLLVPLSAAPAGRQFDNAEDRKSPAIKHEVVVTAARLETPVNETASSVTVVSGEELRKSGKTTVVEALQAVLGTSMTRNGGKGGTASLMMRGANSEHTLVLLDGLDMNDPINPSRSADLSHLSLIDVERIEVLRGPQGPLYGSDALGGVINIITVRGHGKPRFDVSTSAGSLGALAADARFSGSSGRFDFALSIAHERTSGISAASSSYAGNSENDGWHDTTIAARFGLRLSDRTALSLNLRGSESRTDIDNYGGPYGDDPNNVQTYRNGLLGLGLETWTIKGIWRQSVKLSATGSDRKQDNPIDDAHPYESETGDYKGNLLKLDWQNDIFLSRAVTLTAGLEHERERADSEYIYTYDGYPSESSFPEVHDSSTGVYIQARLAAGERFFLVAGTRLDSHTRAGSAVTFRVAPVYIVGATGTRLKATLGTGFKAPSLYQLFAPATSWGPIGNVSLEPERITGWDAGLEQPFFGGRLELGLTYFSNDFRDLIEYDSLEGYINLGRARTKGLETTLSAEPVPGLKASLGYTRLSAEDRDTGETLLRRPRDKFSVELSGRLFNKVELTLASLTVGRRYDRDYSSYPYPTVGLSPYTLVNIYASAPIAGGLKVFLKLENILDEEYESVWGYGTEGRTAVIGVRASVR